jgi:hypothetical protein
VANEQIVDYPISGPERAKEGDFEKRRGLLYKEFVQAPPMENPPRPHLSPPQTPGKTGFGQRRLAIYERPPGKHTLLRVGL